jgi:hypothetical protein
MKKSLIEQRWEQRIELQLERWRLEDELLRDANAGRVTFDPKQGQCGRWVEVKQDAPNS